MSEVKQYVWDDRAPAFRVMGETATLIAEKYCGVNVDEVTHQRWCDGAALMREIDTYYDDLGGTEDEIIARLDSYEDFQELYPSFSPTVLDEKHRDALLRSAHRTMRLGRLVAEATTPYRYAMLRGQEARESADFSISASTNYVQEQTMFQEKFIPLFRSFAIGACAVDSVLDGWTDYKTGKSSIRPTRQYYAELLKLGTGPMLYGMRPLFHPSIAAQGLIMAKKRIVTRIENGMTEYSTMQNIPNFLKRHNDKN